MNISRLAPGWEWLRGYRRGDLRGDLFAGMVVAVMLVPQGMAYALLAGQTGIRRVILDMSGIMWMSLLRGKEVRISFGEFVKCGLAVTPISLLACLAALALVLDV